MEVVAQCPGASAEEMERQVTIPLEVALAGMPGLRSRGPNRCSACRICEISSATARVQRRPHRGAQSSGARRAALRRESDDLAGVADRRDLSLHDPQSQGHGGQRLYSLNDLKSLQDWTLARQFRRIPRIVDAVSFGGTVKRYEIQPEPDRLRKYNITLGQPEEAISASNANAGGDYLFQPQSVQVVRGLGLIGDGVDPMVKAHVADRSDSRARDYLRAEEQRRLTEIRQIVLATTNNVPIRVGDVVDGGPQDQLCLVPRRVASSLAPRPGKV